MGVLSAMLNPVTYVTTYIGVVILIYATSFGLPVPEEVTLILAGAAAYDEAMRMKFLIPVAALTILFADVQVYILGKYLGRRILGRWPFRRLLPPAKIDMAEKRFAGHSMWAIFTVRFISGLRWPTYFSAGTLGVPLYKFLIVETIAVAIHATLYSFVGYVFAPRVNDIVDFVKKADKWIGAVVILGLVLVAITIGYRLGRRKKIKEGYVVPVPPVEAEDESGSRS